MSVKLSGQIMACGRLLTNKHHCASIGRRRTKSLHPLFDLEGQGQSPHKAVVILNKVL